MTQINSNNQLVEFGMINRRHPRYLCQSVIQLDKPQSIPYSEFSHFKPSSPHFMTILETNQTNKALGFLNRAGSGNLSFLITT